MNRITQWNWPLHKRFRKNYQRWRKTDQATRLRIYSENPVLARRYLLASLVVLIGATIFWSILGARLQQANADQLVSAYLFQNGQTFHGAGWPDQHTFLIKWPLFYLIKLFGYSSASFVGITVAVVLLSVGGLAYVLSRIERRPLILGSMYLALTSVLLFVPAQPYPGGLLPVNMAMLTTRNLEYVIYIAALYYIIKAVTFKSKQFWLGTFLLALLVASDHLFLSVSAGAALLALVAYVLRKHWDLAALSAKWLVASLIATLGSMGLLAAINAAHISHIISATLGPYGPSHGLKSLLEGMVYGVGGLLTNFGANPTYDSLTFGHLLTRFTHNFFSVAAVGYLANTAIFLALTWMSFRLVKRSVRPLKRRAAEENNINKLGIVMVWSSLTTVFLFVITNHYYVVDARYLSLTLFSGFIVAACWLNTKHPHSELIILGVPILSIAILSGLLTTFGTYQGQQQALAATHQRDERIAQTIGSHKVRVLVGDYWRVIPTKFIARSQPTVLPLAGCTEPRAVLTTKAWQPDLRHTSFAYLLTFDGNLTDYPKCSLQQVVTKYGSPNSSALIDGSLAHPKELLLFYDQGSHLHTTQQSPTASQSSTVIPISLNDLPHTSCPVPTIMNIVAHQDDDLLFINPDLLHSIRAGHCIRTIYLTAGDAGYDAPYWLGREQGSQAAYESMLGHKITWIQRIIRLPAGQYITVASPRDDEKISLIFMHLPDGNLNGEGFAAYHHQSLARLINENIKEIHSVDGQSIYTLEALTAGLTELLHTFQPAEIRAQSTMNDGPYPDHSDHRAAGRLSIAAHKKYETQQYAGYINVPLAFYRGYTIHDLPANIYGADLADKEAAFMAYAAFDGGVCRLVEECRQIPTYGAYLDRQYTSP